jgi:hypothetical protein
VNALCQTLDGHDGLSIGALRRVDARDNRLAIYQDSARAALGFVTPDLGPRQAQPLAKKRGERFAGDRCKIVLNAINCKRNLFIHSFLKCLNNRADLLKNSGVPVFATSVLFPIQSEFSEQQGRGEKSYANLY